MLLEPFTGTEFCSDERKIEERKMWSSSKVPENLVRIHCIMKYRELLDENLSAFEKKLHLARGWIFQQYNNLKHASKSTVKWFTDHHGSYLLTGTITVQK